MKIKMSALDLNQISLYLDKNEDIYEVEEVLTSMLGEVSSKDMLSQLPQTFYEKYSFYVLMMVPSPVLFLALKFMHLPLMVLIKLSFFLVFWISVFWNWYFLYQITGIHCINLKTKKQKLFGTACGSKEILGMKMQYVYCLFVMLTLLYGVKKYQSETKIQYKIIEVDLDPPELQELLRTLDEKGVKYSLKQEKIRDGAFERKPQPLIKRLIKMCCFLLKTLSRATWASFIGLFNLLNFACTFLGSLSVSQLGKCILILKNIKMLLEIIELCCQCLQQIQMWRN